VALPVRWDGIVLVRGEKRAGLCKGGIRDSGGEAGEERPTTEEAGSKEAAPTSLDADDLFKTGDVEAAGEMSCSAAVILPGGDVSIGRGLI
jgi:hypothetical protein